MMSLGLLGLVFPCFAAIPLLGGAVYLFLRGYPLPGLALVGWSALLGFSVLTGPVLAVVFGVGGVGSISALQIGMSVVSLISRFGVLALVLYAVFGDRGGDSLDDGPISG